MSTDTQAVELVAVADTVRTFTDSIENDSITCYQVNDAVAEMQPEALGFDWWIEVASFGPSDGTSFGLDAEQFEQFCLLYEGEEDTGLPA
jgi:hypothetical protein